MRSSPTSSRKFYNTDLLLGRRISEQSLQASRNIAASASATASWHEDFREDLARIDLPTLVIQGTPTASFPSRLRDCALPNSSKARASWS
jgi:non-heme chloroperoxidase